MKIGRFNWLFALFVTTVICVVAMCTPNKAYAVSDGWTQVGTCEWKLDEDADMTLYVRPLDNGSEGLLPSIKDSDLVGAYWKRDNYSSDLNFKHVVFEDGVVFDGLAANL